MNYAERLNAALAEDDDGCIAVRPTTQPITPWKVPKTYSARQIVYAVRHAKSHPRDFYQVNEYDGVKMTAAEYVAWFRKCLHKKINRDRVPYGRNDGGDGYMSDSERTAMQLARRVNTPRLIVRASEVPQEFRVRLAHRIWTEE